jgi:hypothetical protein
MRKSPSELWGKIITTLIHRGANPNHLNRKGESILGALLTSNVNVPKIKTALRALFENNSDPMLIDQSGDLPIFLAYRNFKGDERKDLVEIIANAYIERQEDSLQYSIEHEKKLTWWRYYRQFRLKKRWSHEAMQLARGDPDMPKCMAEGLPKLLLALATKDILESAKEELLRANENHDSKDDRSAQCQMRNIVQILGDCHTLGIDVDFIRPYDFLSELMGVDSFSLRNLFGFFGH